MKADMFFAHCYHEARELFLSAAREVHAHTGTFHNPHATGPENAPLYLDTAWFGPRDARAVLLNTSGTHGAEGYAGSAAQVAWVKTCGPSSLPPGVAMLMVHAVNPFGFAWGLRGSENNIDLNRNWIDFSRPLPANPLYDTVHPLLCPHTLDAAFNNHFMRESTRLVKQHGQWALEDAVTRGQYQHPDGYHYGGTGPEWSTQVLTGIVRQNLATATHIALVDWHTGPTGNGELVFLNFSDPGSIGHKQAETWWGKEALDAQRVNALWGSVRPTRKGILFRGVENLVSSHAGFTGATIEFRSSRPRDNAAASLRPSLLERWLRFESSLDAPETPAFLAEIREDYAPDRASWRANVLTNALTVYEQTLQGLSKWESPAEREGSGR